VSAGDCWAVGGTQLNVAIADHWDGSAWTVVHLPAPRGSGSTNLPGISCTGVTSCWAAGDYQSVATSKELPYAEHWDGSAWSVVTMPHPPRSFDTEVASVSCTGPADCWAVGTASSGPVRQLIEHWDGHSWALRQVPAIGSRSTLAGVSCAGATDCWITGSDGRNGPLAAHWNGHIWTVAPQPVTGPRAGDLVSTSCDGRACMSVGDSTPHTLAERWNGAAWAVTPTGGRHGFLKGVSCTAGFHCLATGNTFFAKALTEVWNGSAWRTVLPALPHGAHAAVLVGVSCLTATDCWSVGNRFNGADEASLIEHWNGVTWSVAR
jgi:hypothetical protein